METTARISHLNNYIVIRYIYVNRLPFCLGFSILRGRRSTGVDIRLVVKRQELRPESHDHTRGARARRHGDDLMPEIKPTSSRLLCHAAVENDWADRRHEPGSSALYWLTNGETKRLAELVIQKMFSGGDRNCTWGYHGSILWMASSLLHFCGDTGVILGTSAIRHLAPRAGREKRMHASAWVRPKVRSRPLARETCRRSRLNWNPEHF